MPSLSQLDNRLEQIQSALKPLSLRHARAKANHSYGLWSLPRETLLRIVEFVGAEQNSHARREANKTIKCLSLVSREFRELVLDALNLWTTLDHTFLSPTGFETRIACTKNAQLKLNLNTREIEYDEFLPTLENAFSVKDRYRKVDMRFRHAEDVLKLYPSLDFPEVEEAILRFRGVETAWRVLLRSWSFPRIRKLELEDAIPRPGLFTRLTEFRLRTRDIEPPELSYDILHGLARFLAQLECLETLSLDFRGINDPATPIHPWNEPEPLPPLPAATDFTAVHLPTVRSFFLSNSEECFYGHVLASLFRAIRVPNASDVRLRVTFQYGEDMTDCLEVFSASDVATSVSHLSVASPRKLDPEFLVDFLGLFPNVRSLEVEIPSFISTVEEIDDDSSLSLQELRLLTVHNKPACHTALAETCGDRLTTRKEQVTVRSGTGMSIRYLDDYEAVSVE